MEKTYCAITTPLGAMTLCSAGKVLISCSFDEGEAHPVPPAAPLLAEAARQLQEYFAGLRHEFTIPVDPQGTTFQRSVWALLRRIPWGRCRTYGELAAMLGNPGTARAVGMACRCNPIAVIIPCHRVIGCGRKLTGFAAGLPRKRELLRLEGAEFPETPLH